MIILLFYFISSILWSIFKKYPTFDTIPLLFVAAFHQNNHICIRLHSHTLQLRVIETQLVFGTKIISIFKKTLEKVILFN